MIALLSIKPEFSDKIFSGEKSYEYRKVIFRNDVKKVIVYCTKPVGMIVGEFDIEEIIEGNPKMIWNKTKDRAGVCRKFYSSYFLGREKGYAIKVSKKLMYSNPIDPHELFDSFSPPQSFFYISHEIYEACLKMASARDVG
jgi:predicted transcriptional regulator